MKIIEEFVQGKFGSPALCEDIIVRADNFLAVIDGATSKTKFEIDGKSGGRIAAEIIAKSVEKFPADITGEDAILKISSDLTKALAHLAEDPELAAAVKREPPSATVVIYSPHRNEIWRVGDGHVMVDGTLHAGEKYSDRELARQRAFLFNLALVNGEDEATALQSVRAAIEPHLLAVCAAANDRSKGRFAYGVINGDPRAVDFITLFDVGSACEIVLATDGYPVVERTLATSEANLTALLTVDPYCVRENFQLKGVGPGQLSFDDRAYLRIAPCRPAAEAATKGHAKNALS